MKIELANRLNGIGEYYFSQKLREIDNMNKQGANVISLGIGSPDLAPDGQVIETLQVESSKPHVHAYQSYKGVAALREGIAQWYKRWYGVELDAATEILPLIGSKEGIMHICMTYLNEGDEVLVPNPGYPTYRSAVRLAGGKIIDYKLTEENNWQPDFDSLSLTLSEGEGTANTQPSLKLDADSNSKGTPHSEVGAVDTPPLRGPGDRVKLMWVNYPHMPTGQPPTMELFEQLVAFGKKHNILICHDNPYSFILNDKPMSLLAVEGAKDVVVELNSLSKSHNMAGWRVGMLCGAKERIDEVLRFKSNMDSGMYLPVQLAAAKALTLDETWHESLNEHYRKRREKVFELLDLLYCKYSKDQVGMFVWAKIPANFKSGYELSDEVLYKAKVFITPGGIFGSEGDKYIRVSLCSTIENIKAAINRIKTSLNNS